MPVTVFCEGQRWVLNDRDLLGEGGEARVYRHQRVAVKVFHVVNRDKGLKLQAFPQGLPDEVVGPRQVVTDASGVIAGYTMALVKGSETASRLASRSYRVGAVTNEQVTRVFRSLHATVSALHARGVVVGDLNDGNVLVANDKGWLIDVDSMQFGPFACTVAHEKFLDPCLYGVPLTDGPKFTAGTDWYAYSVMLFSSLLFVHPFGGTHDRLPTLLRRAEARHSILRSDVKRPRGVPSLEVLPDDLRHWFEQVFERDRREVFSPRLLDMRWAVCSCGVEHARAACPECHTLGPVLTRQVLRTSGRCVARTAFETTGRVLAATLQGGLRYVYEEQGVSRREDGSLVCSTPSPMGSVFVISGRSTWVGDATGQVTRIVDGVVVERAMTEVSGQRPVLCGGASCSYRQEKEWLIEQETGARVGQVLEGQTSLWCGDRLALGFYRVGGLTVAFLIRCGRAGLKRLEGVEWQGRVVDAHAVFDAQHALLTVVSELDGHETVRRWLFDERGELLAQATGGAMGHATVWNGRVVIASDAGLVALKRDGQQLVEHLSFTETLPFVSAQDALLANPDASLTIVSSRDLIQLSFT